MVTSKSAPERTSSFTMSKCPASTETIKGVRPRLLRAFAEAPSSSKALATVCCPALHAKCNGVHPVAVMASTALMPGLD
eukprot:Skav209926  [mRNA]  locus=scaffold1253:230982:233216:+ [translate_table: standard]